MLKTRYGAVTVHTIENGKVVPRIASGIAIDIVDATPEDIAELMGLIGDRAVVGKDGTLTFRSEGAPTKQARPIPVRTGCGFEIICTRCGTVMPVMENTKGNEDIDTWYDKTDEDFTLKCTHCGEEAYL